MVLILFQIILGWLAADVISGLFHWVEDSFFTPTTPVIGPWIIAANRLHHDDPLAFTRNSFWYRNGHSIIASAAIALLWTAFLGASVFMLVLLIGLGLSNEVHRYAHQPSAAPRFVLKLQKLGVLQSPKQHALHHRPPHDKNFCVLTNYLNPVLA